ncbi:unnamed protein product, partial [Rotaria magnacalcarata]
KHDYRNSITH